MKSRLKSRLLLGSGGAALIVAGVLSLPSHAPTSAEPREVARQQVAVESARKQWREPRPERVDRRAVIRIPALGTSYAVPVRDGVSDDVLAGGLGHFPGSAYPGQVGNYALAGHRVTHTEPLRNMPDLAPGDLVVVETRDWVYQYVIDSNNLTVHRTDVWVVGPRPTSPEGRLMVPHRRVITLVTCASLAHTDYRFIAFGHLVSTTRRK